MRKVKLTPKQMKIIFWLPASFLMLCALVVLLAEDKAYQEETISFDNGDTTLAGTLTVPSGEKKPVPCIIFVHGAQSQPRDGYGYFKTYWQEFSKSGIASFSWDKPGSGDSTGDWRSQSMEDRAYEVLAAVEFLKNRKDIDHDNIGLIGFSQAGWVIPKAASLSDDIRFVIPVSGAIDWVSQGNYFTVNALVEKGVPKAEIAAVLAFRKKVDDLLRRHMPHYTYLQFFEKASPDSLKTPISFIDWEFYKRNINVNARHDLRNTRCPLLALFGGQDAYVDVEESMRVYEEELEAGGNNNFTIRYFPNADHSMIKSHSKHFVHKGFAMYWNVLKWELFGKDAFPEGYFETILSWVGQILEP